MKKMADILNTVSLDIKKQEKEQEVMLCPHCSALINNLFGMFWALCPGFEKQFSDLSKLNIAKTQWILAFMEKGFNSLDKIQEGIKKIRLDPPINIPTIGQFIALSQPTTEDLGFPNNEQAYVLSIKMNVQFSKYQHPNPKVDAVIRHVIREIGSFSYRGMAAPQARKTFDTYYPIALKQFLSGELESITKAIENNREQQVSRENRDWSHCNTFEKAMEAMGTMLGCQLKTTAKQSLPE